MFGRPLLFQGRFFFLVALVLFVLGSATILFQEARPFSLPRANEPRFFEEFAAAHGYFGFSTYSKLLLMRECYIGLDRIRVSGAVTPEKYNFIDICRGLATETVASAPPFGIGWLTAAYGAVLRLDAPTFNTYLEMAFKTSSHEQWLAEKRAEVAENNYGWLSADSVQRHQEDLRLLAQSPVGSEFLAARYGSDPLFRERVVAVVEKLPQEAQERFLYNVRRVAHSN